MIQENFQNQYNYEDLKFISKLGDGSFGIVYLAEYKGEKVAVKAIKNSSSRNCVDSLKQEIRILNTLRHRHLVQLLGHNKVEKLRNDGFTQTSYYIILEYAPNGNLFQYLKVLQGFDEKICRYYFKQLLEVLFYLQNQQICHRDIKLDNILLDENYDLKLADFGYAKKIDERGLLCEEVGTLGYKAPEIQNNNPYNGFIADIFSLGVLLFTLYAGFYPFGEKNNKKLLNYIKTNQQENFWNYQYQISRKNQNFFSNEFKNLIEGMLHPDPDSRFTLDDCLNHVWRNGATATKEQVGQELESRKNNLQSQIESEAKTANYNQTNEANRSCEDEKQYYQDIIEVYKLKFENWQLEKGLIQVLQNQIITHHDVKTVICELIFKIEKFNIGQIEVDQQKFQLIFEVNMNKLVQVLGEQEDLLEEQQEQQDLQQEQQDSDDEYIIEQNLKIMIELQKTEENLIIINFWKLRGDCLIFLNAFQKLKQIIKNI